MHFIFHREMDDRLGIERLSLNNVSIYMYIPMYILYCLTICALNSLSPLQFLMDNKIYAKSTTVYKFVF